MNPVAYFYSLQHQIHEWMGETTSPLTTPPPLPPPTTMVSSSSSSSVTNTPSSLSSRPISTIASSSTVLPSIAHPFYATRLATLPRSLPDQTPWVYQYGNQYISLNGLLVALLKEGKQYEQQQQQQKDRIDSLSTNTTTPTSTTTGPQQSVQTSFTNPAYLSIMLTNGQHIQGLMVYVDNDTKYVKNRVM